jgi:hypothetical protein
VTLNGGYGGTKHIQVYHQSIETSQCGSSDAGVCCLDFNIWSVSAIDVSFILTQVFCKKPVEVLQDDNNLRD